MQTDLNYTQILSGNFESQKILKQVGLCFSQSYVLKMFSFLQLTFWHLCQIMCAPIWVLILFHQSPLLVFVPLLYYFYCCGSVIQFKIWNCNLLALFFGSDCFGYLGSLWFHVNFRIVCHLQTFYGRTFGISNVQYHVFCKWGQFDPFDFCILHCCPASIIST